MSNIAVCKVASGVDMKTLVDIRNGPFSLLKNAEKKKILVAMFNQLKDNELAGKNADMMSEISRMLSEL